MIDCGAHGCLAKYHVGIRRQYPFAACMIKRLLHGGGFSKPSGRWFFAFNDTQAVMVLGECFQYCCGCIRRTVIDGNDLKPPIILSKNGANAFSQDTLLFVASWNKN